MKRFIWVYGSGSGSVLHPGIFTLQTIKKAKCAVGVHLARSIVNGLVHEFE